MVVDVSVTINIFSKNEFFQEKTASWTRYVLGWDFYGTKPVEFVVFDVLVGVAELILTQISCKSNHY